MGCRSTRFSRMFCQQFSIICISVPTLYLYTFSRSRTCIDYYLRQKKLCFRRHNLVGLFVCQRDYAQTTQIILSKFGRNVTYGPRKKRLDYGVNPDYVTSGLG